MFMTDGALVGAQEPAFEERHSKMSKFQGFVSNIGIFTLYNVLVSRGLQFTIPTPPICANRTSFLYRCFDKWCQAFCGSVGHDRHPDASNPLLGLVFHSNGDQGFPFSPSAPFPRFFPADIRLINFNNTGKSLSSRPNHGGSHLVQPRPSRLITTQTKNSFQSQGTGTGFLSGNPPDRSEPNCQGFVSVLKDCPCYHRRLIATFRALIEQRPNRISSLTPTACTPKSVWPSNLTKIIAAGCVCRKRGLEFLKVLGIFHHTPRHYMLWVA